MTKRRNFSDNFKATVALQALRGDKTVQQIAAKRQLHPTPVSTWKRQAIEGMANVFSDKIKKAENKDGEIKELHTKIGQLAVENDFLSQGLKRRARLNADRRSAKRTLLEPDAPVQAAQDQPFLDRLHAGRL